MSVQLNGSTQYLRNLSVSYPFPMTLSAWVNMDDLGAAYHFVQVGNSGSAWWLVSISYNQSTNVFQANHRDTSTVNTVANSTTGGTAATWMLVTGVFVSSTERYIYVNGADKQSNTTSKLTFTANRVAVGAIYDGAVYAPLDGRIAHAAIWNTALTDAEVLALASYTPDTVAPSHLVSYWPIVDNTDPSPDQVGAYNLALIASPTTGADDPTLETPLAIDVSDAGAVSEAVSVSVEAPVADPEISVSESTTVSDSSTLDFSPLVLVSDSISVAETITAIGGFFIIQQSESITVSDVSSVTEIVEIQQSESITVSDASSVTEIVEIQQSESTTVSDASSVTGIVGIQQSESITVSDAPSVYVVTEIVEVQAIAVVEAAVTTLSISVTQTVVVVDSAVTTWSISVSESISTAESSGAGYTPALNGVNVYATMADRGKYRYDRFVQRSKNGIGSAVVHGYNRVTWEFSNLSQTEYDWWTQTLMGGADSLVLTSAALWDDQDDDVTFSQGCLHRPQYERYKAGQYWNVKILVTNLA